MFFLFFNCCVCVCVLLISVIVVLADVVVVVVALHHVSVDHQSVGSLEWNLLEYCLIFDFALIFLSCFLPYPE